ncbi:MAG: PilZ domain-containing protein [Gemmataceae bacterium]
MLASSTVTFWRWLTGQPVPLAQMPFDETSVDERRVCLRYAASLNVRCDEVSGEADAGVLAVICDISRGGIQLISPRRFEPGILISVGLPATRRGEGLAVLACVVRAQPHGDSEWKMGCRFSSELNEQQLGAFGAARTRPSAPDPRGWSRFPCDGKAFYQRVNGPAEPHRPARVFNIAVGGMALLVEEPIVVGELLSTELHDAKGQPVLTILACVVHAQSVAEGQLLGCNFIRELSDTDVQALL